MTNFCFHFPKFVALPEVEQAPFYLSVQIPAKLIFKNGFKFSPCLDKVYKMFERGVQVRLLSQRNNLLQDMNNQHELP